MLADVPTSAGAVNLFPAHRLVTSLGPREFSRDVPSLHESLARIRRKFREQGMERRSYWREVVGA